jgi:hypothetical protein
MDNLPMRGSMDVLFYWIFICANLVQFSSARPISKSRVSFKYFYIIFVYVKYLNVYVFFI